MGPHRLIHVLRSRPASIIRLGVPALVVVLGLVPLIWRKVAGVAELPLPVAIASVPLSVTAALAIAAYQRARALEACLEGGETMRVKASTPFDVGAKPSSIAQERYPGRIPPYVGRPADQRIRRLLEDQRIAIVKGLVSAGKTRTAWEAIRGFSDALLLIPAEVEDGPDPLKRLLSPPWLLSPSERYVLFIDELERRGADLSLAAVRRWLDAHPGSVVIGTIAAEQCRQLLSNDAPGLKDLRRLLSDDHCVRLPAQLVGTALEKARDLYGGDEDANTRVRRLGAYLSSADAVIAHFDASAREQPAAYALALSAVNCVRAGLSRPIPLKHLMRMAAELSGRGRFSVQEELEAFTYCTEPIQGGASLLRATTPESGGPPRLKANSVLVEKADRDDAEANRPAALPEEVWEAVAAIVAETPEDRFSIAMSAVIRGRGAPSKATDKDATDEARASVDTTSKARAIADETDPLREVLEPAARGRRRITREPTEQQLAYARRRAELSPDSSEFDPSIHERGGVRFYRHTAMRDILRTAWLLIGDALGAVAAIAVASASEAVAFDDGAALPDLARTMALAAAIIVVFYAVYGFYNRDSERARLRELIKGTSLAAFVVFLVALQRGYELQNVGFVVLAAAAACTVTFLWRWAYDRFSRRWVVRHGLASRIILLAPSDVAAERCRQLKDALRRPAQFVGYLADDGGSDPDCLGRVAEIADVLELAFVDRVVIADETLTPHERVELAYRCHGLGRSVETLPSIDELPLGASKALIDYVMPLVEISPLYLSRWHALAKRTVDLALGVPLGLFALLPIALFGGLLKARSWSETMLTSDERPGLGGQRGEFTMYRLRTKRRGRKTLTGGLMRRLRIDELPQLWNVVRGEMSLVGPRPLTWEEFRSLDLVQRRRYAVKPGITGLWQIARRREIALPDMVALDLTYCLRWSPVLDLAILFSTIPAVIASPARWRDRETPAVATT